LHQCPGEEVVARGPRACGLLLWEGGKQTGKICGAPKLIKNKERRLSGHGGVMLFVHWCAEA
jgi:hypothetical protein